MSKSISIKLLNHKSVWEPGDTISGQVCFTCTLQAGIQSVSISFEGKAKGHWDEGDKFKVRLFHLQQRLFHGPFTLLPGNMSWPFEFIIPTKCSWDSEDRLKDNPFFDTTRKQQLPPTFISEYGDDKINIEYNLKASVYLNKTFLNKEFAMPIIVIPPRIHEPEQFRLLKIPHSFEVQTLHLDPKIKTRSLTFKETIRTAFKSGTLPYHSFKVFLELPETIEVNSLVNAVIHLEHNLENSTITEAPSVTMSNFSLALKSDISARTPGYRSGSSHQWADSQQICNLSRAIRLPERLEMSNMPLRRFGSNSTFRLQPNTAPTFNTHCVAIRYRWKAKFTLVCATKTLRGEISRPCVVLGPLTNRSASFTAPPPLEEEQLPAYSAEGVAIEVGL